MLKTMLKKVMLMQMNKPMIKHWNKNKNKITRQIIKLKRKKAAMLIWIMILKTVKSAVRVCLDLINLLKIKEMKIRKTKLRKELEALKQKIKKLSKK